MRSGQGPQRRQIPQRDVAQLEAAKCGRGRTRGFSEPSYPGLSSFRRATTPWPRLGREFRDGFLPRRDVERRRVRRLGHDRRRRGGRRSDRRLDRAGAAAGHGDDQDEDDCRRDRDPRHSGALLLRRRHAADRRRTLLRERLLRGRDRRQRGGQDRGSGGAARRDLLEVGDQLGAVRIAIAGSFAIILEARGPSRRGCPRAGPWGFGSTVFTCLERISSAVAPSNGTWPVTRW